MLVFNDDTEVTHQPADFLKNFLVCHSARMIQLVSLPQEAGLVAPAILDMPVKTIVCNVGFTPSEELHLNLAIVLVEVGLDVLLLKLDTQDVHSEFFVKHLLRMEELRIACHSDAKHYVLCKPSTWCCTLKPHAQQHTQQVPLM